MKKQLLVLAIPAIFYAQDLSSLLDSAMNNNKIIKAKLITQESKKQDIEAVKNGYYPTIDVGASYQRLDKRSANQPGDVYSGYANIGIDLYDGSKKDNLIKQNKAILSSSKFDTLLYKKSLEMTIIEDFYTIKSIESQLNALNNKKNQLNEELKRINKFYEAGISTKDDVDNLQAAYSNNIYEIDSAKFQILSLKKLFTLRTGVAITSTEDSFFVEPLNLEKELNDNIKILKENSNTLFYASKSLNSEYLPKIRLEDTYSLYGYSRDDASHPEGLDNQNVLMLSLNMRVSDNGVVSKQRESLRLQKLALQEEIKQEKLTQNINIELAVSKIYTVKAQINSAKSSLKSATSAFETISKKFEVGNVDHVTYLDALSTKTNAKAQYETALNNLQIAYASYYYYANKNIREFIK